MQHLETAPPIFTARKIKYIMHKVQGYESAFFKIISIECDDWHQKTLIYDCIISSATLFYIGRRV